MVTLYLAASAPQGNTPNGILTIADKYSSSLQIYGKYCGPTQPKDCSGTQYAQNIPLIVIVST